MVDRLGFTGLGHLDRRRDAIAFGSEDDAGYQPRRDAFTRWG
jgi:hypothetical protein